ncbi:hypothetical protein [Halorubrum distributum]|uniref:hypothetical protein n=1 Tax=Halorubrum distributum TaxID=29283 RepID=UPI0009B5A871|nr:hypothetical protein [Halorubrum arcis]
MKNDLINTLYQPEYTGENRCEPCTLLNVVLAGLLSSTIARKSRVGGYAALLISIGLIYLRGYLIPGTPELTKRYLPPEVLRWFGKEPQLETRSGLGRQSESGHNADGTSSETPTADPLEGTEDIDLHDYLLAEGILEPCEDQDDLCLVAEFRTDWDDKIAELADKDLEAAEVGSVLGVEKDAEEFEIEQYGDAWTLVANSRTLGRWPSQGALLADVGATRVLDSWSTQWSTLAPAQRGQILNGLRLFLKQCPGESGSVSMDQETVESCCSSHEVITVSCDETGDRLFEQPLSEV